MLQPTGYKFAGSAEGWALVRGDLSVRGEPVNLKCITCPLLNVLGRFDELVPPRAGAPLTQLIGSDDTRTVVFPSSHVGMAAGFPLIRSSGPRSGNGSQAGIRRRRDAREALSQPPWEKG